MIQKFADERMLPFFVKVLIPCILNIFFFVANEMHIEYLSEYINLYFNMFWHNHAIIRNCKPNLLGCLNTQQNYSLLEHNPFWNRTMLEFWIHTATTQMKMVCNCIL